MNKKTHFRTPNGTRHFDHIYPNDFLVMDYYRSPDLTKEEEEFVKKYVEKMTKFILSDELDYVTRAYKYLLKTEEYSGSYDRMKTYYMLIRSLDLVLTSMVRVQKATYKYIFNIPFSCDDQAIYEDEIRLNKLQAAIEFDLKLKDLSVLLKKNPFIYEIAWTCLIDKLSSIREMVGIGLRLSLEYDMRWGVFCDKECCLLPDKYKWETHLPEECLGETHLPEDAK
jgi:hypothetical protein